MQVRQQEIELDAAFDEMEAQMQEEECADKSVRWPSIAHMQAPQPYQGSLRQ